MNLLMALVAVALLNPYPMNVYKDHPQMIPTVNLSAIRYIECNNPVNPKRDWTGTGSLIKKNTILTAYHVAAGNRCYDRATGNPLKPYYIDKTHDLALMTGDEPVMPYIKYSCEPYHTGETYMAYGTTGFMSDIDLFRQMKVVYTGEHVDIDYGINSTETAGKGIAMFNGTTIPGQSGGPYLDSNGYMHGIVNAGDVSYEGVPQSPSYSYELKDTVLCKHT